jgi:hypothetical protein
LRRSRWPHPRREKSGSRYTSYTGSRNAERVAGMWPVGHQPLNY